MSNRSVPGSEDAQLLRDIIDDVSPYTKRTKGREAEILKSIINYTAYTANPQSEIEELLLELKEKIDSNPTILPLTATSNGEYSETGKAYSPVTVAVPVPPLYRNSVSNLPAETASFSDGLDAPLCDLIASVDFVQSGSGQSSPTNIRPISGRTGANIHVADGETPHVVDNVVTVSWKDTAGTVYAGILDTARRILIVTHYLLKINQITSWSYYSSAGYFRTSDFSTSRYDTSVTPLACEAYNPISSMSQSSPDMRIGWAAGSRLGVKDSNYTDVTAWLEAAGEYGVLLKLKKDYQTEYTLAFPQIRSLLGANGISVDCGNITALDYISETEASRSVTRIVPEETEETREEEPTEEETQEEMR